MLSSFPLRTAPWRTTRANTPLLLTRGIPRTNASWTQWIHSSRTLRDNELFRDDGSTTELPTEHGREVALGTITTTVPSSTMIEELISRLEDRRVFSGDLRYEGKSEACHPLLALFLTPAFAQYAADPDLPLRAWEKMRGAGLLLQEGKLNAVVGVVDRLPGLTAGVEGGGEGMGYFYQRYGPVFEEKASPGTLRKKQEGPGTLHFHLPASLRGLEAEGLTLQLPLAQTLFHTGRVSTLVHTQYTATSGPEATALQARTSQNLHALHLTLPLSHNWSTHFPLLPLTPPRLVRECMGNIISKVSQTPASGISSAEAAWKEQPASKELEAAVAEYFEERDVAPQPVSVWALVIPNYLQTLERVEEDGGDVKGLLSMSKEGMKLYWRAGRPAEQVLKQGMHGTIDSSLRLLLQRGARLCRVLSGGGGWGKKAGLLSLDPEVGYEDGNELDDVENDAAPPAFFGDTVGEPIAREGSAVMFFVAPGASFYDGQHDTDTSVVPEDETTAVFGVVPSTLDSIPAPPKGNVKDVGAGLGQISHRKNFFGVLSEGGMALTLSRRKGDKEVQTRTRVDAPFTRFTFQGRRGLCTLSASGGVEVGEGRKNAKKNVQAGE